MKLSPKFVLSKVILLYFTLQANTTSGMEFHYPFVLHNQDTLPPTRDILFEEIGAGRRLVWGTVTSTIPSTPLRATKPGRLFDKASFDLLHYKALKSAEESGYPFAVSRISEVRISGDSVHLHRQFDPGPLVLWDSIIVSGPDKLPERLILSASGIQPGTKYKEYKIKSVKSSLESLPFLECTKDPEVIFTSEGSVLLLNLKKKKANRANLLIAIQPRPSGVGYYPVGEANLVFHNLVNQGERFSFDWKSFGGGSQKSNLTLKTPFLFNSPLGLAGSIKLQKQDSTFNTFSPEIGPLYALNSFSEVALLYGVLRSGFGRTSTANIKNISERRLTLGYSLRNTDRPLNPKRGILINATLATGKKTSEKYRSAEDNFTDNLETGQLRYHLKIEKFTLLLPKWTLLVTLESGIISNRNDDIFQSEMFRLGGLSSIRGQDEESIFTPQFHGGTIEIRYLLDATANVHLFVDGASVKSDFFNDGKTSLPMGFGAGFSFGTGGMIFTLDYAVGSDAEGSFLLRNNRVHLGFSGVF